MSNGNFKGKPVKPDVELLLNSVNQGAGETVSHEMIASIIGAPPKSTRFRTVTTKFREELRNRRGIDSRSEGGHFRLLDDLQASHQGRRGLKQVARHARRVRTRTDQCVDPRRLPTEDDKKAHGLLVRELHALDEAGRNAVKAAAPPKDVEGMPRGEAA